MLVKNVPRVNVRSESPIEGLGHYLSTHPEIAVRFVFASAPVLFGLFPLVTHPVAHPEIYAFYRNSLFVMAILLGVANVCWLQIKQQKITAVEVLLAVATMFFVSFVLGSRGDSIYMRILGDQPRDLAYVLMFHVGAALLREVFRHWGSRFLAVQE